MKLRCYILSVVLTSCASSFASDGATAPESPTTVISGTMGLSMVNGVTDSQTYNFLVSADRTNPGIDTMHLDGGYFFSRQSTATDPNLSVASNFAFINGRYDKNISSRLAAYVSAGYRVDNPDNLELRSLYGVGGAYCALEGKSGKWVISGGGAYRIERYTDGSPTSFTQSAAFGSQYTRSMGNKVTISHTLSYIPAFSDFSNYVMTSVFSLGYQLSKPLKLTINNVVDFQSDPSPGSLKKSSQWFIGLSFGGKA